MTALALIVLGAGLLALRSPAPAGVSTARRAVLVVVVLADVCIRFASEFARDLRDILGGVHQRQTC